MLGEPLGNVGGCFLDAAQLFSIHLEGYLQGRAICKVESFMLGKFGGCGLGNALGKRQMRWIQRV